MRDASTAKRAVIYVRLSVSKDASVSIERQIEAAQQYAAQRGWTVVEVFRDDGVSASKNRPEDRNGWRDLMACTEPWDVVIIWKLDRLVRRVVWFWESYQWLNGQDRSLVSVMDNLDMTTAMGRIVAGIVAGFAEMEAEATSVRVADARRFLLNSGRVVGGTVPYGWRSVPNPDGPGFVLAKDPERVRWVTGMAERVLAGQTVYSVCKWLDAEGAPLPRGSQRRRKSDAWRYATVERLLRSPMLAGMVPFNPGNTSRERGQDVVRDHLGMPVIDESVAILSTDERRRLLALLDAKGDAPQARPRSAKGTTSPLLSRLVSCGHCLRLMHRGTTQGRPSLSCPSCHQTISTPRLVEHITDRLLAERGDLHMQNVVDVTEDNAVELADIEEAIRDVTLKLGQDNADRAKLLAQLDGLQELRRGAKNVRPSRRRYIITDQSVATAWEAAQSDEERREVLAGQLDTLRVVRGKVGRYLDPARVQITWKQDPYDLEADLADTALSGVARSTEQARVIGRNRAARAREQR